MKIGELSKRTNTPRETIHHYIREGLLRKPHKIKGNMSNYSEGHVETLLTIKELREHYYLPLPEIKKYLKQAKKKTADVSILEIEKLMNQFMKHMERLFPPKIIGKDAFCKTTGLESDYLEKLEKWRVILSESPEGESVYSNANVIIGRLVAECGKMLGEENGADPEDLKRVVDFFEGVFFKRQEEILMLKYGKGNFTAEELMHASLYGSLSCLLIFYLFRRTDADGFGKFVSRLEKKE